MAIKDRRTGWLTAGFHAAMLNILHCASGRYSVIVPAYCLMPDHLHLLAAGITNEADQLLWARFTRRMLNPELSPCRLQKQAYDHVLRPSESRRDEFASLVHYLIENPVRAGLATAARAWPFTGSVVPDLIGLDPRQDDFAERWWPYWARLTE